MHDEVECETVSGATGVEAYAETLKKGNGLITIVLYRPSAAARPASTGGSPTYSAGTLVCIAASAQHSTLRGHMRDEFVQPAAPC